MRVHNVKALSLSLKLLATLLTILYQLIKFEAPSYKYITFRDILITNFQWPNLQRVVTRKKSNNLSFTWPSLKLLGIIVVQMSQSVPLKGI